MSTEPKSIFAERILEGRVAFVTGGGTGITGGVARALAEAGARVALVSRKVENLEPAAAKIRDAGVDRIVYTDVSRDGMLAGPNLEQTCAIARESGLRVTASGGVSSLEDLKSLKTIAKCGVDSVIVGKALYEGRFTLKEALKAA